MIDSMTFTLWIIGTYFFPLFNAYPYVYVGGIRESGKTKLLTLSSCLSFNSVFSVNISVASIFRLLQNCRSSLFVDETEMLSNLGRAEELRSILLGGYKKGTAVYRTRKTRNGDFIPEPFEVHGPKMLANIEGLEGVLESRCVQVLMRRGADKAITNREIETDDPTWQQIRDLLYSFLMKYWKGIKQSYSEIQNDTSLSNRNWELWKAIFAMARFFDTTLLESMKNLADAIVGEQKTQDFDTPESILLETLLILVDEDGFYKLSEIKDDFVSRLENCRYVDNRYVGRLLRRLVFNNKRRRGTGFVYFLQVSDVRKQAQSLGIDLDGEHSEHSEGATGQGSQRFIVPEKATPEPKAEESSHPDESEDAHQGENRKQDWHETTFLSHFPLFPFLTRSIWHPHS